MPLKITPSYSTRSSVDYVGPGMIKYDAALILKPHSTRDIQMAWLLTAINERSIRPDFDVRRAKACVKVGSGEV